MLVAEGMRLQQAVLAPDLARGRRTAEPGRDLAGTKPQAFSSSETRRSWNGLSEPDRRPRSFRIAAIPAGVTIEECVDLRENVGAVSGGSHAGCQPRLGGPAGGSSRRSASGGSRGSGRPAPPRPRTRRRPRRRGARARPPDGPRGLRRLAWFLALGSYHSASSSSGGDSLQSLSGRTSATRPWRSTKRLGAACSS